MPRLQPRGGARRVGVVEPVEPPRGDRQSRRRGGVAPRTPPRRAGAPGLADPVETDRTDTLRLHRLPLRAAGRSMTVRLLGLDAQGVIVRGPPPADGRRTRGVAGWGQALAPPPLLPRPHRLARRRGRHAPQRCSCPRGVFGFPPPRARPGVGASPVRYALRWAPPGPRRVDATAASTAVAVHPA